MEALISWVTHPNAPLALEGRRILAELVIEDGWVKARAAERLHVSLTTISKWVRRYRARGKAGLLDHSSRPQCSPHRPAHGVTQIQTCSSISAGTRDRTNAATWPHPAP